jgi:predicted 3-demethylubiquinone-9 3-methyltransferase (glyoxalase superfamily)
MVQKVTPHLWYDTEAVEAAEFYCSVLPDSKVTSVTTLPQHTVRRHRRRGVRAVRAGVPGDQRWPAV